MTFTNKMLDSEATTKLLSELTATNKKMVNEIERLSARLESIEEAESRKWYISKREGITKLYKDLWDKSNQRNVYHWTSTALHEKRDESEKSHLQVSRDDYRKVVVAIQKSFELEEHINVKSICAQMDKAASIDGSNTVPSTQLYLILRFLKANRLIRKSGGSSYEYVGEDPLLESLEKAKVVL